MKCLAELVIRNARLVLPEGIVRGELSVEKGRIHEIAVSGLEKGDKEINAKDKIVIPGVIDACVHFYTKKSSHREDFHSCSIAAAAGGITTIIVTPLDKTTQTTRTVQNLVRAGRKNSIIDFAIYASGMGSEFTENASKIASLGVRSFRVSTEGIDDIEHKALEELMNTVKLLGGIIVTDVGSDGTIHGKIRELRKHGRKDPLAHVDTRPSEAEEEDVKEIMEGVKHTKCKLHISSVTTRRTCEIISDSKKKKLKVSTGTCPHFLIFTKKDMTKFGPFLKVDPPLRTDEDRLALWNALSTGTIDIVTSDHIPIPREEKEEGWKNIWGAPAGIPGVETLLPLILRKGTAMGRLTLENVVNILCTKPAQIFGFYPRKGVISKGSDADLVMIDLRQETTVTARKFHSKIDWTPYEGLKLKGIPTMTISRGTILMEDGEVVGKSKRGQFLAA